MIKRLRSISAELAGALLGRCGCRRRGGVGAKAAPVCHAWMPLWEGCPAVDGLYGCCRCARARVRRAVPQCTACDKAALERLSLGSGWTSRLQGLPSPRGLGEWLARRIRRGAALLPGARAHKVVERVAPSRADDAVTAERDIAKRTSLSITTRNAAIRWTERATTSFTYLCFVATAIRRPRSARINASSSASVIKKRARRARTNASRASRARKPRRRQ